AALHLLDSEDYFFGELEQRFRMRGRFTGEDHRFASITAFADIGIEFDRAQKRHTKLLRSARDSAFGEDIDFLVAMRANKMAPVLHDAQKVITPGAEHLDGLAGILQGNIGGRGDYHCSGQRDSLEKRD